jgi:hypothetical protein
MDMPIFKPSHPYFEEALEYQILLVGIGSMMPLRAANQKIIDLVSMIVRVNKNSNERIGGTIAISRFPPKLYLADGRESDIITLYNCHKVFDYISGQAAKPKSLRYSVKKNQLSPNASVQGRCGSGLPSPVPGMTKDTGANVHSTLKFVTANLIGGAFEKVKHRIVSSHTPNSSLWPVELQFFRHLRNGCFHGNQFDIRKKGGGRDAIDQDAPPKWHLYTMTDDASLNGQQVVGGFFPNNQVLPFLYRMGNIV